MRRLSQILFLLLVSTYPVLGQQTTISPFSRISVGDFQQPSFAQNFAMGGLSYAVQTPNNINTFNPASYSRLFWTSFEAAAISKNIWLESKNQSQAANVSSFNHLSMGFPIAPWWGMAFALMPVSQVGYDYKTAHSYTAADGSEVTYNNSFIGNGGLNKALLGHGFSIKRRLFFGFNFSYYFGDMEYQETIDFTLSDNFHNSANLESIETGDIYLDFGAQYKMNVGSNWRMELGAIFMPVQGLRSYRSNFNFTYSDVSGAARLVDTVSFTENAGFSIVLPPKYGFGFMINREERFSIGVDVDYTMWSLSNYNTFSGLEDVYSVKTGMEYKTENNKHILRLGARYGKLPIVINNSTSDEMAITAGMAFPIKSKERLSYTVINVGVEVGKRGKIADQWVQEKFINVNVGLTLNNKWFIKRVFD